MSILSTTTLQDIASKYESGPLSKKFYFLVKRNYKNMTGSVIWRLETKPDGCEIVIILGCLGSFSRKPGLFVAKQFRKGDRDYIRKSLLKDWSPIFNNAMEFEQKLDYEVSRLAKGEPPSNVVGLFKGICG